MTFNFWSLDYIYYPVSGIMWVWHKIFGAVLGPDQAITWVDERPFEPHKVEVEF